MVFKGMFGGGKKEAESAPPEELDDVDVGDEQSPEGDNNDLQWAQRAAGLILGGASTGSKRYAALYGDIEGMPSHFARAAGCHLYTTDDETLVDCTMALGSVALGYAEPDLTRNVIEAIAAGSVSALSPALEVLVAERFCAVVPCAERVQF